MKEKRCYGCMRIKSNESVCEYCGYEEGVKNEIHQLPEGTILKEQYMIGRVLGQGGFGITYLGWDMYLDIPVAIKEYFPSGTVMRETQVSMDVISYSGDVGVRFRNNKERFLREAKMLARFSQVPEIVQIKNFFLANNTAYIVMEYVDGITLKQYVSECGGKLSAKETFALVKPVISALCKVHKSGLVHRDISPDNIMMLPEGTIKLLDFGAVRDVGDADVEQPLTKSTEAILKQGYAPIEQYQNRGSLGPWTDVYALCATIYYCLTGEIPPDAPERLLGDDELRIRELVPELTETQEEVLRQGMALRAQDRIASMDELYEKLYVAVKKEVTSDEVHEKKNKFKLQKSQKIAILVVGIVLLVYGIGFADALVNLYKESDGNEVTEAVEGYRDIVAEGECGEGLIWSLDTEGVFVLDGEGQMDDYNAVWMDESNLSEGYNPDLSYAPWAEYILDIQILLVGDHVTKIGTCAFNDAENLREIQWSNAGDLHEIGWLAFANIGIEGVTIPASVEVMGASAFSWCKHLKYADLPYRLGALEADTFVGCLKLGNVVMPPYTQVQQYTYEEEGREITVTPFFLTGYENEEDNLRPENLQIHTYEGSDAERFALEYDVYHEYMHGGFCGDDILWEYDSDRHTLVLKGTGDSWVFGVGEEEIEAYREKFPHKWVFSEMPDWTYTFSEEIEHIVVEEGIKHLNATIFGCLPNLKTVDLGSAVFIDFAFYECSSLEEVVIPESMYAIGGSSFAHCTSLRKVEILGETEIRGGAFADTPNMKEIHCSEKTTVNGNPFELDGEMIVSEDAVFYVYEGSPMYDFVKENGYAYEIVK